MLRLLRHRCNPARSPIISAKWQVKPPTSGSVLEKTREELQAELSVSEMKETGVGDLIMVTCQICHADGHEARQWPDLPAHPEQGHH